MTLEHFIISMQEESKALCPLYGVIKQIPGENRGDGICGLRFLTPSSLLGTLYLWGNVLGPASEQSMTDS